MGPPHPPWRLNLLLLSTTVRFYCCIWPKRLTVCRPTKGVTYTGKRLEPGRRRSVHPDLAGSAKPRVLPSVGLVQGARPPPGGGGGGGPPPPPPPRGGSPLRPTSIFGLFCLAKGSAKKPKNGRGGAPQNEQALLKGGGGGAPPPPPEAQYTPFKPYRYLLLFSLSQKTYLMSTH